MSEYYAIQRSDAWLAHYGVKGMKWGVRIALKKGDVRALRKHYLKAMKKINKLNKMSVSGRKYGARAAAYGVGAAALGGAAIGGPAGLASLITRRAKSLSDSVKYTASKTGMGPLAMYTVKPKTPADAAKLEQSINMRNAAGAITNFGKKRDISRGITSATQKVNSKITRSTPAELKKAKELMKENSPLSRRLAQKESVSKFNNHTTPISYETDKIKYPSTADRLNETAKKDSKNLTNNNLIRLGLGAAAVGMGAAAARNAYKARNGEKYRQKAIAFQREVENTFGGIDYSKVKSRRRKRK